MLNTIFTSVLNGGTDSVAIGGFMICLLSSLIIGIVLAVLYSINSKSSRSFVVTLAALPAIVCGVIMMVNGNIGAGVAVAGAFALVRFRSVPGTAKEISSIFLAMAAGLMTGMGYIGIAIVFSLLVGAFMLVLTMLPIHLGKEDTSKVLRITIPEDLEYESLFDEVFDKYTDYHETVSVKTSNMGTMYKLRFNIQMKKNVSEQAFLDDLRCRNGNLEISLSKQEVNVNEL